MTIQRIFSDQEALEQFKETHPQFNSAQQIAAVPESEFVECYAEYFADGKKQARRVHQLAVSIQQRTALAWANIRAAVSPALQQAPFNNLPPSFLDHQESIPNYQQIFNNLDFLECDPCRSVLSPAAYFVDIMRFVDDNITQRTAGTVPANTIPANLTLRSRRPDLFSLSLDCDNTFSLVPYIDLVNEVLEGLVTNTRQQDAITVLDTEVFPLNLPLNLPLEEIRGYLDQVDLSLEQVYETFDRETVAGESINEAAVARETLSLSPTELELCQTETLTPAELTQRYGLDAGADLLTALQNVPTFLEQTGLTRQELNDLLYQDLSQTEVTVGLSRLFFVNRADDGLGYLDIKQGPADATDPRRPPQETILNLSLAKLDRIYRFIKLARKLGWTFKELDWALRSLQPSHIAEQVLQFDGINDHVAVTDITVLDRSTLTIEAWVNPSQQRPNPIISKGQASDHRLQFMLWVDAEGRLAFYDQFQDGTAATPITPRSGRSLPTGVFSHIAVTINGPTLQFYINGELDQTVTLAQSPQIVGSELNIGRDLNDTSFAGLIADVRVWATVRSAAEIQAALYQRFTGQEADLLAYWSLTASVSDLIEDRTPNANHGVLGGEEFVTQPTWVQADLLLDTLPAQLGPEALNFNGTDQFLARQGVSGLGLTALTLEAWILVESV
ncbi:MAG: LamG-like jellyroll fold domain-containing protein, partial [Cyanobacteria bacterium P01_F01_bin.116]